MIFQKNEQRYHQNSEFRKQSSKLPRNLYFASNFKIMWHDMDCL